MSDYPRMSYLAMPAARLVALLGLFSYLETISLKILLHLSKFTGTLSY
jgi:hypothetical protein